MSDDITTYTETFDFGWSGDFSGYLDFKMGGTISVEYTINQATQTYDTVTATMTDFTYSAEDGDLSGHGYGFINVVGILWEYVAMDDVCFDNPSDQGAEDAADVMAEIASAIPDFYDRCIVCVWVSDDAAKNSGILRYADSYTWTDVDPTATLNIATSFARWRMNDISMSKVLLTHEYSLSTEGFEEFELDEYDPPIGISDIGENKVFRLQPQTTASGNTKKDSDGNVLTEWKKCLRIGQE